MSRSLLLLALLAMMAVALAGCVAPAGEPLRTAGLVGGSTVVPDVAAPGAEVTKLADAVQLVWRGEARTNPVLAAPRTPLPLGVRTPALLGAVDAYTFEVPVEVTRVDAALAWADGSVDLNLFVRNAEGRTQCRSVNGVPDEPNKEACGMYKVGPREGSETWTASVANVVHNGQAPAPYELALTLGVRPFQLQGPALAPAARSPALGFWATRVDEERKSGEPSLKVDAVGNAYIAAPTGRMSTLWRTADGGASFEVLDIEGRGGATGAAWSALGSGGGDSDVFVTEDGQELYFADLWDCQTVGGSADAGATWWVNPLSCEVPFTDRQWVWARPGGHVWLAYNGFQGATVLHSIDGGRTWLTVGTVPEDACPRGNIVVDADGRVFLAGCNRDGPGVAASEDGGRTFTWHTVAPRSGTPLGGFCYTCAIFTVVDLDTEGNLYAVWADPSEGGTLSVWLSTSRDQAATWSEPVRVNGAPGTALLPWVAAGKPGHVAVAWYQARQPGDPSVSESEWYVHLAESVDALAPRPAFAETLVQEEPVQYGPICIRGSGCKSQRNLLDFLMVDVDHHGRTHVAYNDGSAGGSAANSFVMYARQVAGQALDAEAAGGPAHGHPSGPAAAPRQTL